MFEFIVWEKSGEKHFHIKSYFLRSHFWASAQKIDAISAAVRALCNYIFSEAANDALLVFSTS
jgi:hypothetical protein